MKTKFTKMVTYSVAAVALAVAQSANAIVINDGYVGSNFAGDVLGNPLNYNITSMNVDMLAGNILSVKIHTNFAGKTGTLLTQNTQNPGTHVLDGNGIGYGDLFLSSGWTPSGAAPYANDNHLNGNKWTYGFALDDRFSEGGTGTFYQLNGADNDANAFLSDDFMKPGSSFRHGQEVAVDTANQTALASGVAWTANATSIEFLIDVTGTGLATATTIGLHWGMSCANDVIEGGFPVPEPAILGLLALGLIGIGFSQRRKV